FSPDRQALGFEPPAGTKASGSPPNLNKKKQMQLQQGDILLRKNSEGDTLWLSERLVMDVCNIKEDYFRKRVRPAYKKSVPASFQQRDTLPISGKSWRWAKINGAFYYDLA
ncbi:hypothetical protein ACQ1QD_11545, partial [Ornithobacterium rhinotracheale]